MTAVTPEQVIQFLGLNLIPMIIDMQRVALFQISLNFKWEAVADAVASSRFGIFLTYFNCFFVGGALAVWFGGVEPTLQSLFTNSLVVLGYSTALYKFAGYEKSDLRKNLTSFVDQIGPSTEENDAQQTEVTVG